jgi:hypothetical protein
VTVRGNLNIDACSGTAWNGFQGPDVVIHGSFDCRSNAGPCLAWLGTVGENALIQSNKAPAASDVSLVSIGGNLHCQGNSLAPTHVHGPSWVEGQSQGQCASFATTATSIATPVTPTPCANLVALPAAVFPVPNTVILSAEDAPAGNGLPQRCIVSGQVNPHISPVDHCEYVSAFQVQLPAKGERQNKKENPQVGTQTTSRTAAAPMGVNPTSAIGPPNRLFSWGAGPKT